MVRSLGYCICLVAILRLLHTFGCSIGHRLGVSYNSRSFPVAWKLSFEHLFLFKKSTYLVLVKDMHSRKKAKLDDDIKSQGGDYEFTYGMHCNITTDDYQFDTGCGIPLVDHFGLMRAVTKHVVLTPTSTDAPTTSMAAAVLPQFTPPSEDGIEKCKAPTVGAQTVVIGRNVRIRLSTSESGMSFNPTRLPTTADHQLQTPGRTSVPVSGIFDRFRNMHMNDNEPDCNTNKEALTICKQSPSTIPMPHTHIER